MAHMTREFSLVLLGAGLLTGGSFVVPERDLELLANQQAAQHVAGRPHVGIFHPIIHATGRSGSPARPSISRGGFGSLGRSFGITG